MAERTDAKKKVRRIKNLPTVPSVVLKITSMVENPDSTPADVGKLISRDQVITAKVLRMANSPFFGMSRKISSITQALIVLGFDVVKGMVLTSSVSDLMKNSFKGLWEHSIGCAAAAGVLARKIGRDDAEEVLLAGLMHDIGKVIMALEMKPETGKIVQLAKKHNASFYDVERKAMDFNHTDVGMWLAEHWNLPPGLSDPIRYHHHPEKAPKAPEQAAIVNLADIIVRALGVGFAGDPFVPPLTKAAWDLVGFKPSDFNDILEDLEPKLDNIPEDL